MIITEVAHNRNFKIELCKCHRAQLGINYVRQHQQTLRPHILALTETSSNSRLDYVFAHENKRYILPTP